MVDDHCIQCPEEAYLSIPLELNGASKTCHMEANGG